MMRIGVVAPRQPPTIGGGFTFHTTVLKTLDMIQTDHEFFLLDIAGLGPGEWAVGKLPLIDVKGLTPEEHRSAESTPTAEFAANRLGLDVVWYLDPLAEVLSVPVFATVLDLAHRQHPFFPEVSTRGWKWNSRESHYQQVLPRAARIFTGTRLGKEQIVRCYGVNPANVIVNPFPAPEMAGPSSPEVDRDVLLKHNLSPGYLFYPAQFWAHKNHVNLLLALPRLEKEFGITPHLVLTGSDAGNLAHVKQLVSDLCLIDRVSFLGFVPAGEMSTLYRNATALVYPSLFGPDNLPPLEAFASGCPVLTGQIEGAEEQLGKDSALFFDPVNPAEIAESIARIVRDEAIRARIVNNGRELAAGRTPEAYVQIALQTMDAFEHWRLNWPALPRKN